jgi:Holliday junction DNA helicase RuvA
MFAHLKGKIHLKQEKNIILTVNDVGYLVTLTRGLLENINEGDEISLFIYTNVREDDISLFGFKTKEEWQFFKLLLTVSGIGPKSAMEILNAPTARVRQAIAKRDAAYLTQIQGIGKKTAERIIVDLQGKIKEEVLEEEAIGSGRATSDEIVQALVALGYHRHQVVQGLKKIPEAVEGEEAIIKYFLQNI